VFIQTILFGLSTNSADPQHGRRKGAKMLQTFKTATRDLHKEAAHRAVYVADEFDRARGPDVAYHASHALHSLAKNASSPVHCIGFECAEMVRRSVEIASPHVLALFPDPVDRSRAALALSKAKAVAGRWGEAPADRQKSDAATLRNEIRHVEWLRNCCHNLALLDEIEEFHTRQAREARKARQAEGLFS
jgi:hypothetical protein